MQLCDQKISLYQKYLSGQSLGQVTIGDDLTDSSSVHRTQSDDVPPSGASIHRIEVCDVILSQKYIIKVEG